MAVALAEDEVVVVEAVEASVTEHAVAVEQLVLVTVEVVRLAVVCRCLTPRMPIAVNVIGLTISVKKVEQKVAVSVEHPDEEDDADEEEDDADEDEEKSSPSPSSEAGLSCSHNLASSIHW